jgi:hypothetical protein
VSFSWDDQVTKGKTLTKSASAEPLVTKDVNESSPKFEDLEAVVVTDTEAPQED